MNSILLFGIPGGSEWIFIGIVLILLFGAKKIPQLMRGMGSGIKEFKDGMNEGEKTAEDKDQEKLK